MENTILIYNNSLNFNLKKTMNNANDLLYNIQNLKQLQWDIDNIQRLKDVGQMQVNMASLAMLRNFILDEAVVGVILFRNIIRKYYPLNDRQITVYENNLGGSLNSRDWYYITNIGIIKRRGSYFDIGETSYRVDYDNKRVNSKIFSLLNLFCDAVSLEEINYFKQWPNYIAQYSCYIDFHKVADYFLSKYSRELAQNEFIIWDWKLVEYIANLENCRGNNGCCDIIKFLLNNPGFFAQMGVEDIDEILMKLQNIAGTRYMITEDIKRKTIEKYKAMGATLYSYLSLSKEFIIQHQDDLNWTVLQRNPRIQWDLELVNMLLKKIKNTVCETEWNNALQGTHAIYVAIKELLNDELLSDIEKLYDI